MEGEREKPKKSMRGRRSKGGNEKRRREERGREGEEYREEYRKERCCSDFERMREDSVRPAKWASEGLIIYVNCQQPTS